jgi:hypothetical protein
MARLADGLLDDVLDLGGHLGGALGHLDLGLLGHLLGRGANLQRRAAQDALALQGALCAEKDKTVVSAYDGHGLRDHNQMRTSCS